MKTSPLPSPIGGGRGEERERRERRERKRERQSVYTLIITQKCIKFLQS